MQINLFRKKENIIENKFPKEIKINGNNFNINVDFIKKKSSSCSIKNSEINFRLSAYLNKNKAEEHFNELLCKIVKKIEKNGINFSNKNISQILEEENFEFAGEIYYLEYHKARSIKLKDNTFYINPSIEKDKIEEYIGKLLCKKFKEKVFKYLEHINSNTYNFHVRDFSLKHVKSKWGHCTHDNKIMLNIKLLNTKREILDYVIIHELSHIKHKNHSKQFWEEVEKFCPDYKKLRNELKNNPPSIFK